MSTALLQRIPASVRDAAYLAILVAGFGLGGIQTAYLAADMSQPQWLIVAFAVYSYVAGVFGLTASQNVDRALKGEPASTSGSILDLDPTDDPSIVLDDDIYAHEDDLIAADDADLLDDADEYEGRRIAETEDH